MASRKIALIGAGYWGKNLARNFYELGCLAAISDPDENLLTQYAQRYPDVQQSTDASAVIGDKSIDAVAIAAPAALHFALAQQAIAADKDVYVEKPLCLDAAQGQEIVDLARRRNRILMVGHLLQYHPCVELMQELIGRGELGQIHYITANRLNLGKIRQEENALWSFAPHDVSVILSLVGGRLPTSVRCTGGDYLKKGVADTTITSMRFGDGIRAHVHVSWLSPFKEQRLVVTGSHGLLVFDDTRDWDEKVAVYRHHVTWQNGQVPTPNKGDPEYQVPEQAEPLRRECEHFLECCLTRTSPKTDGKEGLRVLKLLQAATMSLEHDGEAVNPANLLSPHAFIHPTAVIDVGARIGTGSKIWHFSHLMPDCEIGEGCNLGQNVVISPGVRLGRNVKVQNNVSIYSGVTCEDDVFLGPSMVFTNIPNPRSAVVRRDQYVETVVRRGASIGANATVICGNEIGEHAFVGAGSVVTKPVKPYALVVGNPARQIGWMSRHGTRLDLSMEGNGECRDPSTGEIYRVEGGEVFAVGTA